MTVKSRSFRVVQIARAALVLAVAVTLSGCFGARADKRRYYSLPAATAAKMAEQSAPQAAAAAAPKAWRGALHITTLTTSPVHDRVGFVLRRSNVELRYSSQHLWVKRPQHLVADRLAETLRNKGLFDSVVRDLTQRGPAWVLRGRLSAMEVLTAPDGGGPWRVRLALRLALRRTSDRALLWRGAWARTATLPTPTAPAAARKLGELLDQALHDLVSSLQKISLR